MIRTCVLMAAVSIGIGSFPALGQTIQPETAQSEPIQPEPIQPEPIQPETRPTTYRGIFLSPPRLLDAETTFNRVTASNATYFFTVELPANAGTPLQQLQIAQRDGSSRVRRVQYELEETQAFVGTPDDQGNALNLGETRFERDSQTLTVSFDPPVPPGTTVTLRLRPERNPRLGGVYLFGVTAYPAGAVNQGQFLGYGRLHFYDNNSLPFF